MHIQKRITNVLKKLGYTINHKKVYRLMKELDLKCIKSMRKSDCYGIRKRPTLDLVIKPLEEAIDILKEHATVRISTHSDQGWYYQHNCWVETEENNVFQSMVRKATCAVNAAMEHFFGILKQEMYYGGRSAH